MLLIGVTTFVGHGACSTDGERTSAPDQTRQSRPALSVPDRQKTLIMGIESEDYSVVEIGRDDKALRVNVSLGSETLTGGDVKRITLNALYDIQARVGKEEHLAVWSYSGRPLTIRGMAFYSSLTDTYHFKGPEELD